MTNGPDMPHDDPHEEEQQRRQYEDDANHLESNDQYYPGEMDGGQEGNADEEGHQVYVDHYEDDGNGGFSVTKKLVDSRLARKQAEDDVKLLANRIALLKMEEQKVCYTLSLFSTITLLRVSSS